MRIVHTSDWHAGRLWKSRQRLPEIEAILSNLGDFIEREKVDLLLVSGDVFDNGAPNAEAERVVFSFFKRVGRSGTKTVVIAGNHDSPTRLEAWGTLAELVDVHAVGLPRAADRGGVVSLGTRSGEGAQVAVIPFARVGHTLSALQLAADETAARQQYADVFKQMVANVCGAFRDDGINLLMAHTHLDGAIFSRSERAVHLGQEWAATPQALPSRAHYVALGHIHKPQKIDSAPSPTYYAGSPIQLDFGEAGEQKSFVLIEARPRAPARIERIPYEGGRPLLRIRGTFEELQRDAQKYTGAGYLEVTVQLDRPESDLNGRIRRLSFGEDVIRVEMELPATETTVPGPAEAAPARPVDLFRTYHQNAHGREADAYLLEAFEQLLEAEEQGA